MKRLLLAVSILFTFHTVVWAQEDSGTQSLAQLKGDYNQVRVVAHVKIESIKLAAPDVHPLYIVRSQIIEPFKGRIKRDQSLDFYFNAEDDYDVKQLVGKELVVFLNGGYPLRSGGKGLHQLENSSLAASPGNIAQMRKIKLSRKVPRKR